MVTVRGRRGATLAGERRDGPRREGAIGRCDTPPPMRHATRALLALTLPLALAACADADRAIAPTPIATPAAPAAYVAGEGLPTGLTRYLLERASAGLTYTSESDYPFTWYMRPGAMPQPVTVEAFRAALGIPATTAVEVRTVDEFFARHIDNIDPYDPVAVELVPRYEQLVSTIRFSLRDPKVFRVGRIAIDCYIVGLDRYGQLVGLRTVAIET